MHDEDRKAFMQLLDDVIRAGGDDNYRPRIIKAFGNVPTPHGVTESTFASEIHTEFAAHAVGCEMLYHIQDHGGVDCVADMIKMRIADIYKQVLETIEEGCIECSLDNPLKGPNANAQLVKEILEEDKYG